MLLMSETINDGIVIFHSILEELILLIDKINQIKPECINNFVYKQYRLFLYDIHEKY